MRLGGLGKRKLAIDRDGKLASRVGLEQVGRTAAHLV